MDYVLLKRQCMDCFEQNVLPYINDPRQNFRATAVLNFHGILDMIDSYKQQAKQQDIEADMLKREFLSMPVARHSRDWAMQVLTGVDNEKRR